MLSCFLQSSLDVSVQLDGRNQTHLAVYDEEQFKRSTLDGSGVAIISYMQRLYDALLTESLLICETSAWSLNIRDAAKTPELKP